MRKAVRRSIGPAFAVAATFALAACAIAPTSVPTAESIRGLKTSGAVVMNQALISGTAFGTGVLTFQGQSYPFTILGTLIGPGAIAGLQASGAVYNLTDLSQFSGTYLQGTSGLAVAASITPLPGEIWLKNNHGVIMRLQGEQTGLALTRGGRSELFINLAR
jgi:hypothetical protein